MPKMTKNNKNARVDPMAGASLVKKMDQLLSRIPKGTFATVGGALGGPTGAMIGKGISTITGYGDYTVSHNSLMNKTVIGEMADQVPVFRQQGADTRVKHCEFVADIVAPDTPADYNVVTFNVDPTDSETFPWLSAVARKYQRYKVKGMVIGYRSTSTDYNNSGVVAITVNYDPAETQFDTMEGLLNTKFAVSTKPSCSMIAPVECDPARSPMDGYYIKHLTSGDNTDATFRQTMLGKINVATTGLTLPAGTTLGQLYISYDIELLYPYLHALSVNYGIYSGPTGRNNQTQIDNDIRVGGVGFIKGYGEASVNEVAVKWIGDADSPGAWCALVFPPGKYRVLTLDSTWKDASSSIDVGSQLSASAGASILFEQNATATDGGTTYGNYIINVSAGHESDRTLTYGQQESRATTGSPGYVTQAFSIIRL